MPEKNQMTCGMIHAYIPPHNLTQSAPESVREGCEPAPHLCARRPVPEVGNHDAAGRQRGSAVAEEPGLLQVCDEVVVGGCGIIIINVVAQSLLYITV